MHLLAFVALLMALLHFRFYWMHRDRAALVSVLGWGLAAVGFFTANRLLLVPSLALILFGTLKRLFASRRRIGSAENRPHSS